MHLNYYLTFRLSATAVFQLFACLNPLPLHRQLPSLGFLDCAIVQTLHLFNHVIIISVLVQDCLLHQAVQNAVQIFNYDICCSYFISALQLVKHSEHSYLHVPG